MLSLKHIQYSLSLCLLLLWSATAWAQPQNNDCANAIFLNDISDWCSDPGAFSNGGATDSGLSASCFPSGQDNNDVWFAFTAEATTVNISVTGAIGINAGGTLRSPQFALYEGSCGALDQVACASDAFNDNAIGAFASQLTVGATYYIQVSARNGNTGTFRLCVNNYNQTQDPSSDCSTAVVLCDKDPFTVDFVVGAGNNPNEIGNVSCNSFTCQIQEANSAWYKWTCEDPGTLTFTLTPLNSSDDLDFVLYELPNGVNSCSDRDDIRCMASGENVGAPFSEWAPCTGATGLAINDGDTSEGCGCSPGDNNFLQAVEMVEGRSYALVVLNFSASGAGFSISFGGTGTFRGPQADFTTSTDTVCVGDPITFTDASTFEGVISERNWDFGQNANPATVSGTGPHNVTYNRPGLKSIVLQVESSDGCIVTEVKNVFVECCDDHFDLSGTTSPLSCPGANDGAVDLSVGSDFPPYQFSWSTGADTEDITGLDVGDYTVTITDESTCETEATFTVDGRPDFAVDTLIGMPTCNGGMDGSITLNVSGATPPYEYSWQGGPFINDNTLQNLPVGDYEVTIRDVNGCEEFLVIPVRELELQLDPNVSSTIDPSCTGFSDGSISLDISNGQPPYQYDFNDGRGFVDANELSMLPAGVYTVDVRDANLCMGSFSFTLQDPPPLQVSFELNGISCFGQNDAMLTALASGGVGGYSYLWAGGETAATLEGLGEGTYQVTVTDANGCMVEGDTSIVQPQALFLNLDTVINAQCFGEPTGFISVVAEGGVAPFEFSADGQEFQPGPAFDGLPAGTYEVIVRDANGCTATVGATISEPAELIVDAGPDQFLDLGLSTRLNAVANDSPVSFSWSPPDSLSCTDCASPQANPVNSTVYTVTGADASGCTAVDSLIVRVVKNRRIYIPNAFSPNADGSNDLFTVYAGPGVRQITELKVFNRWGGLVFERSNFQPNEPALGWDGFHKGEPAQSGVYTYYAKIEFIDGVSLIYDGDVSIVR